MKMVCTACKKLEPIFYRKYSGERLCKRCFIKSIEKKVRRTLSLYQMLAPHERIAVALSGGKDSLSLLHLLIKIKKSIPIELIAITIDEGIKGYREEALKHAKEACKEWNIQHRILSFEGLYGHTLDEFSLIAREKTRLTPCSICGILRRKALNFAAKEIKADKLATAHNLDDEIQTLLINILHGNIRRIAWLEPIRKEKIAGFITRIKPLCQVPENEIALYAYLTGIKFQTNSCPYMHGTLRSQARLMLNRLSIQYPGIKFKIFKLTERIRSFIKPKIKVELKLCEVCEDPCTERVCRACEILSKLKF